MSSRLTMIGSSVQEIYETKKELFVIEAMKKEMIRVLGIFWLVSAVFLFLRIILKLMGSDPQSLFAAFIYLISDFFLLPFFGIFPQFREDIQPGKPVIDITAFIAIFCYTVLVLLSMSVIWIIARMLKTGKQMKETVEDNTIIDPTEVDSIVK